MTNAQLISQACHDRGITEPVHTFAYWKQIGFNVRRGEHALMKIYIWKGIQHETKSPEGPTVEDIIFMKKAAFFGRSQVEPISNTQN